MKHNEQRVVVTGMGAVTAYGSGGNTLIDGALAGKNTIQPIRSFSTTGLPATIGSEVDPAALESAPEPFQSKTARMAWVAATEAQSQAGSKPDALCAAIGWAAPPDDVTNEAQPGASAQDLYAALGCSGPLLTDHAACSAGLHAFAHAARLIRSGKATTCLAGAADSRVHPMGIISYARLGVLNTSDNGRAARASRPFNWDRAGFIVGEGTGFLMLESLEHAQQRKAPILGELAGWALANDADNLTDPRLDGTGAIECIQNCLERSGCSLQEIDYLNAHGTSTLNNDQMEATAYRSLWPDADGPAISSSKSMIGHLSMASGAVESLITLGVLQQGILPPTLNLTNPDPITRELNLIGPEPVQRPIRTALKTSFGLGGQNAAIIWKKWSA
ncbi:MAG: beta-ketoacyl-[acyl-carrier-protein] synthase family protein [Verrucomicrobiota bacterium]